MNDANDRMQRPPESDFHAYVDGQLAPERYAQLERWLAGNAEDTECLKAWQRHKAALHSAYDETLNEPIPERLRRITAARRKAWSWRMAAALACFSIGGLTGFFLRSVPSDSVVGPYPTTLPASRFAHNAAIAHAVYSPEVRHPVEVAADQETHLVQWLSKRLGTPLKVPQFTVQGFDLIGGRLLPGDQGAAAQFMYQDASGRRLTLYVRSDAPDNGGTAFRFALEGKISIFYWLDGQLGYALSAEMPREQLLQLAEAAYRQLSP